MIEKELSEDIYGFIITKPLQLMIVLALLDQLPREVKKEILIVNYFENAKQVSIRLSKVALKECKVIFLMDAWQAFNFACNKKYKKLFIDSDVGFVRNLILINLKVRSSKTVLAVYEEGLGTYRDDLYSGLKRKILKTLGCGVNFGGNWLTRELYIYKTLDTPCKRNNLIVNQIITAIEDLMAAKMELLIYVFNVVDVDNLSRTEGDSECIIYLTGWSVDNECLKMLDNLNKKYFIKQHPHVKNKINCNVNMVKIDSGIPAEIILNVLSVYYDEILVIHHGSSVDRYVENKKIKFILTDSFKRKFQVC